MNYQLQHGGSCVISIVGTGGLGKTTLARKLYHSIVVINHFYKRIWITVSQENSLMGLLRKLIEEVQMIEKEKLEKMTQNDLIDVINDSLGTQRFLIVLDDVWREDVCIQMERIFRNVKDESRILITTGHHNVAMRADPRSTPHELPLLNDDESMKLLLKKAFPYEDVNLENCSSELLDVGRHLIHKCSGLPLALVVLGGFLSIRNKTPIEWRRVLETMDWEVEGRACQEILALSYEDLPHHMQLCFLYLGAYPENCVINGTNLIRKWVGEGFIPQEERKTMEDIAEDILEELIQRSLIHVNKRTNNGSVKTFGVHDLLLDFARSTAKRDRFLTFCSIKNGQPISSSLSHRLAIDVNDLLPNGTLGHKINARSELRSLLVYDLYGRFEFYNNRPIVSAMFRFRFLRVLDLIEITFISRIPKEIKLMIHLRYLGLFGAHKSGLPSSIGKLQLLETIEVALPVKIPITLWKIKTLRHVLLNWCTPPQSLKLDDLLTLDCVTFGSHETINWSFPNLRKLKVKIRTKQHGRILLTHLLSGLRLLISLHIMAKKGCPIEINPEYFPFHDCLRSLTLRGFWSKGDSISEFPIYLTKIELCNPKLNEDPMPKLERLQYLVTLRLLGNVYIGKTIVCLAGGFPMLESLLITNWYNKLSWPMPNLEEWSIERDAMAKLRSLVFASTDKLKMLPDFQHMASLQTLQLYGMSQRLMYRSRREDWHKIQNVPKLSRFPGLWSPSLGMDRDEGRFSDGSEDEEDEIRRSEQSLVTVTID